MTRSTKTLWFWLLGWGRLLLMVEAAVTWSTYLETVLHVVGFDKPCDGHLSKGLTEQDKAFYRSDWANHLSPFECPSFFTECSDAYAAEGMCNTCYWDNDIDLVRVYIECVRADCYNNMTQFIGTYYETGTYEEWVRPGNLYEYMWQWCSHARVKASQIHETIQTSVISNLDLFSLDLNLSVNFSSIRDFFLNDYTPDWEFKPQWDLTSWFDQAHELAQYVPSKEVIMTHVESLGRYESWQPHIEWISNTYEHLIGVFAAASESNDQSTSVTLFDHKWQDNFVWKQETWVFGIGIFPCMLTCALTILFKVPVIPLMISEEIKDSPSKNPPPEKPEKQEKEQKQNQKSKQQNENKNNSRESKETASSKDRARSPDYSGRRPSVFYTNAQMDKFMQKHLDAQELENFRRLRRKAIDHRNEETNKRLSKMTNNIVKNQSWKHHRVSTEPTPNVGSFQAFPPLSPSNESDYDSSSSSSSTSTNSSSKPETVYVDMTEQGPQVVNGRGAGINKGKFHYPDTLFKVPRSMVGVNCSPAWNNAGGFNFTVSSQGAAGIKIVHPQWLVDPERYRVSQNSKGLVADDGIASKVYPMPSSAQRVGNLWFFSGQPVTKSLRKLDLIQNMFEAAKQFELCETEGPEGIYMVKSAGVNPLSYWIPKEALRKPQMFHFTSANSLTLLKAAVNDACYSWGWNPFYTTILRNYLMDEWRLMQNNEIITKRGLTVSGLILVFLGSLLPLIASQFIRDPLWSLLLFPISIHFYRNVFRLLDTGDVKWNALTLLILALWEEVGKFIGGPLFIVVFSTAEAYFQKRNILLWILTTALHIWISSWVFPVAVLLHWINNMIAQPDFWQEYCREYVEDNSIWKFLGQVRLMISEFELDEVIPDEVEIEAPLQSASRNPPPRQTISATRVPCPPALPRYLEYWAEKALLEEKQHPLIDNVVLFSQKQKLKCQMDRIWSATQYYAFQRKKANLAELTANVICPFTYYVSMEWSWFAPIQSFKSKTVSKDIEMDDYGIIYPPPHFRMPKYIQNRYFDTTLMAVKPCWYPKPQIESEMIDMMRRRILGKLSYDTKRVHEDIRVVKMFMEDYWYSQYNSDTYKTSHGFSTVRVMNKDLNYCTHVLNDAPSALRFNWKKYLEHLKGQKRLDAFKLEEKILSFVAKFKSDPKGGFAWLKDNHFLVADLFLKGDELSALGKKNRPIFSFKHFLVHLCGFLNWPLTQVIKMNWHMFNYPKVMSVGCLQACNEEEFEIFKPLCHNMECDPLLLKTIFTCLSLKTHHLRTGAERVDMHDVIADRSLNKLFMLDVSGADRSFNSQWAEYVSWIVSHWGGKSELLSMITEHLTRKTIAYTKFGHRVEYMQGLPTGFFGTTLNNTFSILGKILAALINLRRWTYCRWNIFQTGDDCLAVSTQCYEDVSWIQDFSNYLEEYHGTQIEVRVCSLPNIDYVGCLMVPMYENTGEVVMVPVPLRWLKIGTFHSLRVNDETLPIVFATYKFWSIIVKGHPIASAWCDLALRRLPLDEKQKIAVRPSLEKSNPSFIWDKPEVLTYYESLTPHPARYLWCAERYNISAEDVIDFETRMSEIPSDPDAILVRDPVLDKVFERDLK